VLEEKRGLIGWRIVVDKGDEIKRGDGGGDISERKEMMVEGILEVRNGNLELEG
jgi:hypothetical protein